MLKKGTNSPRFLLALGKIIIRSTKPAEQPPAAPPASQPSPPPPAPPQGTGDQKAPPATLPAPVSSPSPPLPPPPQSFVAAAPPPPPPPPPAPPAPIAPPHAAERAPATPHSQPETKPSEPEQPAPPKTKEADADKAPAPLPGPLPQPIQEVPAVEKKIREYRYRTRLLKSMLLPMLFGFMSIMMLYNYVNGFEPYFSYHLEIILAGFLTGFITMSSLVISNVRTAKKKGTHPLNNKPGVYLVLAFLIPYIALMLFVNPAQAWRFSIGYFFSAVIPPLVLMAYESSAHGKFYVQEEEIDDGLTRNLAFRP